MTSYNKKWYEENKERLRPIRKRWWQDNRNKQKEYARNYRIKNPGQIKKNNEKINKLKARFLDKYIFLGFRQQTGSCSKCSNNVHNGTAQVTHMHHLKYIPCIPWACRVELCARCHGKLMRDNGGSFEKGHIPWNKK